MSVRLQELIHKLEVGAGYRLLTYAAGIIAFVAVAVFYDSALYRNMSTAEGMDAAQLARNVAEGKGYHTDFIRPLGIHLLEKHARETGGTGTTNANTIGSLLKGNHPDLTNPPAYPYLLAFALKLMPFDYDMPPERVRFEKHNPDLWIAGVNQVLLLLAVVLVFWVGRTLFDYAVAWLSAAVMVGTEVLWQFTTSGLPTLFLMVLFLGALAALVRVELLSREMADAGPGKMLLWAGAAGLLLGAGALTKYSFGLLLVPAVFLIASGTGRNRMYASLIAVVVFAVVLVPWLVRNYSLSGTLFGTAGLAVFEGTSGFPGNELQRTLRPEFGFFSSTEFTIKFIENCRQILQHDIGQLGGSWVVALFLTGLLVPFRNVALGRLRWFVVGSLGMLFIAQAIGGARGSHPHVRSDNLLIVVLPAVFAYGVALLYNLLEQFALPAVRTVVVSIFYLVVAAPLVLAFLAPSPSPIVYPPYYPPWIHEKGQFVRSDGWMASDIPWAVAWYADRPSVWIPLGLGNPTNSNDGFYALQNRKPLDGLYLTPETLKSIDGGAVLKWRQTPVDDKKFSEFQGLVKNTGQALVDANASQAGLEALKNAYRLAQQNWVNGGGDDWRGFTLGVFLRGEVPEGFPLRSAPLTRQDEIFLTESERPVEKSIKASEHVENP